MTEYVKMVSGHPLSADATEDVLFAAMQSVAGPRSCCYVAGPLTSSRAILLGHGFQSLSEIEAGNRSRMQEVAGNLRRTLSYPVIDSSILRVPGWAGPDYGRFFLRVIEELCFELRFVDDWQYSMGATKEFVRAQQLGIHCYDEVGGELAINNGVRLIERVLHEIGTASIEDPGYMRRLRSLLEIR
jgi:hypothetical protein